jgi:hypothetical protein
VLSDVAPEQCPPSGKGECQEANGEGDDNDGGTCKAAGDNDGRFGFMVRRPSTTQQISGYLQYGNPVTGTNVRSVSITSLLTLPNIATFSGTCTNNGLPCVFTVNLTDSGVQGTTDTFTMSVDGGPPKGGRVCNGKNHVRDH